MACEHSRAWYLFVSCYFPTNAKTSPSLCTLVLEATYQKQLHSWWPTRRQFRNQQNEELDSGGGYGDDADDDDDDGSGVCGHGFLCMDGHTSIIIHSSLSDDITRRSSSRLDLLPKGIFKNRYLHLSTVSLHSLFGRLDIYQLGKCDNGILTIATDRIAKNTSLHQVPPSLHIEGCFCPNYRYSKPESLNDAFEKIWEKQKKSHSFRSSPSKKIKKTKIAQNQAIAHLTLFIHIPTSF